MRFKGLSISKEQFEEKYLVELTDLEGQILSKNCEADWEQNAIIQVRGLALKSIKTSMASLGYKLDLKGTEIVFRKR